MEYLSSSSSSSSSYSITKLGQGGLFRFQHSRRPVVSSVVVVFLLDGILEFVQGVFRSMNLLEPIVSVSAKLFF
jgi:hypothetical protein